MLPRDQFDRAAAEVCAIGTRRHGQMLYGLVRWLQPEFCVEVGTYAGGTAVWIARALQENAAEGAPGQLVCIDDFSLRAEAEPVFWYNMGRTGVGSIVSLARGKSDAVEWPARVDFAHIDGDHSYDGCNGDVERAIEQGARCLAVHDVVDWWGPRQWYGEFKDRRGWQMIASPHDAGLAVALQARAWPAPVHTRDTHPAGAFLRTGAE